MSSKAKLEGNARHQAKLDRIVIQPYKEQGEQIKAAAAAAGQSVSAYILQAVRERMERESRGEWPGSSYAGKVFHDGYPFFFLFTYLRRMLCFRGHLFALFFYGFISQTEDLGYKPFTLWLTVDVVDNFCIIINPEAYRVPFVVCSVPTVFDFCTGGGLTSCYWLRPPLGAII